MPRVPLISPDTASGPAQVQLAHIHQTAGGVTNMFKAVAHAPAALKALWGTFAALSAGALPAPLRERIAIAVADRNQCGYCLSAHTFLGRKAGVPADELRAAQSGESTDPRSGAALRFALHVLDKRGAVSDAEVEALRHAGFTDEELVEVVANVALNVFANYMTVALQVPGDFPKVPLRSEA